MTEEENIIKNLKKSLRASRFKVQRLEEEVELLKGEIRSNEPMYENSDNVDHLVREYSIIEKQFKEFMDDMKSFRKWFKYIFNIKRYE